MQKNALPGAELFQQAMPYYMAATGAMENAKSPVDFKYDQQTLQPSMPALRTNLLRSVLQPVTKKIQNEVLVNPQAAAIFNSVTKSPSFRSSVLAKPELAGVLGDIENGINTTKFNAQKTNVLKNILKTKGLLDNSASENYYKTLLLQHASQVLSQKSKMAMTPLTPADIAKTMELKFGKDMVAKIKPDLESVMGANNKKVTFLVDKHGGNMANLNGNLSGLQNIAELAASKAQSTADASNKITPMIFQASNINYKPEPQGPRFNVEKFVQGLNALKAAQPAKTASISDFLGLLPGNTFSVYGPANYKILRRRDMDVQEYEKERIEAIDDIIKTKGLVDTQMGNPQKSQPLLSRFLDLIKDSE